MKNLSLIVILCFISNLLMAQNDLKIENLTSENSDILYIGLVNKIKISNATIDKVKIGNSEFKSQENQPNVFNLNVQSVGAVDVEFYNGEVLINKKTYTANRVPEPKLSLSSVDIKNKITVDQILKNPNLQIDLGNCKLKNELFTVLSFDLTLQAKNNFVVEAIGKSELLPAVIIENLPKLKTGDNIFFENVKIKGPEGIVRKIPGIQYSIL